MTSFRIRIKNVRARHSDSCATRGFQFHCNCGAEMRLLIDAYWDNREADRLRRLAQSPFKLTPRWSSD